MAESSTSTHVWNLTLCVQAQKIRALPILSQGIMYTTQSMLSSEARAARGLAEEVSPGMSGSVRFCLASAPRLSAQVPKRAGHLEIKKAVRSHGSTVRDF